MTTRRKLTRDEEPRVVTTKFSLCPPVHAFESLATVLRQLVGGDDISAKAMAVLQRIADILGDVLDDILDEPISHLEWTDELEQQMLMGA